MVWTSEPQSAQPRLRVHTSLSHQEGAENPFSRSLMVSSCYWSQRRKQMRFCLFQQVYRGRKTRAKQMGAVEMLHSQTTLYKQCIISSSGDRIGVNEILLIVDNLFADRNLTACISFVKQLKRSVNKISQKKKSKQIFIFQFHCFQPVSPNLPKWEFFKRSCNTNCFYFLSY